MADTALLVLDAARQWVSQSVAHAATWCDLHTSASRRRVPLAPPGGVGTRAGRRPSWGQGTEGGGGLDSSLPPWCCDRDPLRTLHTRWVSARPSVWRARVIVVWW